jgi:hypothetical protein
VFPTNNVEKCGNIIAVSDGRRGAVEAAERGLGAIGIRLRPLHDATTRFLFHETLHGAYDGAGPDLLSAIDAMPPFRGNPGRAASEGAILVEPLARVKDLATKDWHGRPFSESARLALLHGGGAMNAGASGDKFVLSGLFWRAIARGSGQGGMYLLDSVRHAAGRGRLSEFLAGL